MNTISNKPRTAARLHLLASAISLLALTHGGAAVAQTAAPGADQSSGVEDIIVTAQRREQRLQDVPVAVTAIGGNSLESNRIQTVIDLTGVVPGLMTRANTGGQGSPSFAMRGVSSSSSAASQDREISQYLDGVYMGGTRGVIFDIADLERIEVLRGPQGTLFGRNATAGAISLVTRDPGGQLGFRQDVSVGNQGQFRTRTTIDTPTFGPFSGYVTYVHDQNRGDVRNLGAGTAFDRSSGFQDFVGRQTSPKYLGGKNVENVFAALKFEPEGSSFKATYKFDWVDGDLWQEARTVTVLNTNSAIGGLLAQILAAQPAGGGRFGPTGLNPSDLRPDATNNGWTQRGFVKSQGHNLTSTWQVSDHLTLKNITAYRKGSSYGPATIAGLNGLEMTPGALTAYSNFAAQSQTASLLAARGITQTSPGFAQAFAATFAQVLPAVRTALAPTAGQYFTVYDGSNAGKTDQFSSEIQANYTSTLMDLVVGALYYHSNESAGSVPGTAANYAFTPVPELLPLGNPLDSRAKTRSIAGYAQGDIHITPQLDLQLGGRVTSDRKETYYSQGGTLVGSRDTGTITPTVVDRGLFKTTKFTYSIGLNYKPNDNTLLYAKYSTGFLSGGSVGAIIFQPEEVKSYEAGLKTEVLDRRLRFNLALWHATYDHLQQANSGATVGRPDLGVVVVDAGTVKAKGVEVEVAARLTDGLSLGGQVGYTDKKITNINPILLLTQTRYELANIPAWVGGVNAQYVTQPFWGDATALLRVDGNYQGKARAITDPDIATNNPAFAPYAWNPGRWLINARLAVREIPLADHLKAEIALWGRNLNNSRKPVFGFPFANYLYTDSFQRARQYGVDVSIKY